MNKLNETNTAQPRLLSDAELTQVVGGRGHHRRWGRHGGNQGRNGNGNGNGNGRGSNRPVIILVFNDNDTTIINNTTFFS